MTDSFFGNMVLKERYRLEGRIGTGGMARVFKAFDTNLERPVAIKILHDYLAADPTFKARFIREAKFIAGFNHPNIVQVYDFDVIEFNDVNLYFMVMPYIPGQTLKEVLDDLAERGESMPRSRVLEIFKDITGALNYAHARGMIHRDVKPANILFDENNHAVLTDFGIARLVEGSSLTQEGLTTGTPAYMSPEQVSGAAVDTRSDIYALGIILFEMLSGTVPYSDESGVSTMLKHIQAPVPLLSERVPDTSRELDSLIARALAKNPQDRFTSAAEFFDSIQPVLADEMPFPSHSVSTIFASGHESSTRILPANATGRSTLASLQAAIPRSPQSILRLGIGIIVILVITALITQGVIPALTPQAESDVPSMTYDTPSAVSSSFDPDAPENDWWPQDQSGSLVREIVGGAYHFRNERPGIAAASILETEWDYRNTILTLTGQLEADSRPASAYGIIFRYVDDDNYYVFAADGSRRYSIWVRKNGVWEELRNTGESWTFNDAIKPLGESNELSVTVINNHFVGLVNGKVVADVLDDTISAGKVGIYLATPGDGGAGVLIDSYEIETKLSTPSMTGDR
jgi:serine/threonine protein kinase